MARAVVSSSLLKAAVHGRDPNWGRIAGAAGNGVLADAAVLEAGGLPADEAAARAGTPGCARPGPVADRDRRSPRIRRHGRRPRCVRPRGRRAEMDAPELLIRLDLGLADGTGEAFGCDLTEQYVIENSEYTDVSEILVVKLGGTTIAEQSQVLEEVATVARQRPVVLVHGGGKRITEWLERLGVPSRFEGGLRVTDPAALEVAAAVLRESGQQRAGLRSAQPRCRRGRPVRRRRRPADRGTHPRIGSRRTRRRASPRSPRRDPGRRPGPGGRTPLARDEDGIVCNVNADDAAAGIAAGLGARQLVLMTDVDGVRDAEGRRLDTLTVGEAEALIVSGVINGGMVPKIRAALAAVTWEGSEAIIADSAAERALERSLGEATFGTRITVSRPAANVGAT